VDLWLGMELTKLFILVIKVTLDNLKLKHEWLVRFLGLLDQWLGF
jgi:hypothetical protein